MHSYGLCAAVLIECFHNLGVHCFFFSLSKKKEFGTDVAAVESVRFTDNLFSLGQCLLMFVLQSREQYLLEYHMALFIFTWNNRLGLHLWLY